MPTRPDNLAQQKKLGRLDRAKAVNISAPLRTLMTRNRSVPPRMRDRVCPQAWACGEVKMHQRGPRTCQRQVHG